MDDFLNREYMDNTMLDYLIALGIILIGSLIVTLIKKIVLARLKIWAEKTETKADDFVIQSTERFGIPALHYFVIFNGIHSLNLHAKAQSILNTATAIVITFLLIRLISTTILHLLQSYIRKQERGEEKLNQLGGLMLIINAGIWLVGIVFLLDNLHFDVTAIIAGLGIGGIAIALAAQNILGDLFNYFVIFFDRPFEVGDFIIVDDKLGTIEYIGLKTTRIRSLSGEQLVIGNASLTSSRIHNYKRLARRRAVFSIDVEYGTPLETLKEIPELLKAIVTEQELATLDRAHFTKYADWSLRFEVVFFVEAPEMVTYLNIQQEINFRIYEEFQKRGIQFAFPSQSVYWNPNKKVESSLDRLLEIKRD
jgi:small-conductance mechanosensitive channel